MKILLVEDDTTQAQLIAQILKQHHTVHIVHTLGQAEEQFHLTSYDLFIIDLTLGDENGLHFCKYIRKHRSSAAILILTGERSIDIKVKCFEAGADDYISKPFHANELLARVQALSRRSMYPYINEVLQVDDVVVDTTNKTVTRNTVKIKLRPKEFEILVFLMKHRGTVVTRSMLLDYLWDDDHDTLSNVVDAHIKSIRETLDKPFPHHIITTVRGYGYKIEK